jgi:hypothetical protein
MKKRDFYRGKGERLLKNRFIDFPFSVESGRLLGEHKNHTSHFSGFHRVL